MRPTATWLHEALVRWRVPILTLLIAHFVALHYFVLGFVTWDGFGHRVPPVVELVQHGSYGLDKFSNWALINFRPFLELTNAPFLWAMGLRGLLFAFAVGVFPFCVAITRAFVLSLTGSPAAAFYSAAVYVLVPLVNAQLFSGCVDWAIPGFVAFYLDSLLVIGRSSGAPGKLAYVRLALATCLFTMARQQAVYLAIPFFVVVGYCLFVERRGFALAVKRPRVLALEALTVCVGLAPAISIQVGNYLRFGSPIHPFKFELLGFKIGDGVSMRSLFAYGGLKEYTLRGFWDATLAAYFVPEKWPYCFFDGRNFGESVFAITALLGLPLTIPKMNRETRALLATFMLLAFAAKDFWMPRYAYGVLTTVCICNGLLMAALLERPRVTPVYVLGLIVLAGHALRPEWDAWRIHSGDYYPRINVSGSPYFISGNGDVPIYPDRGARLLIVRAPNNRFVLPLYGRHLTNSIVGTITEPVGPRCETVRAFTERDPDMLVVDDENLTKDCPRACVIDVGWRCAAFRMLEDGAR
jgi:hypothetical protein